MDKQNLNKYIQSLFPMSLEKMNQVSAQFEFLDLAKNKLLIHENKII
jgi:hypothetical protein